MLGDSDFECDDLSELELTAGLTPYPAQFGPYTFTAADTDPDAGRWESVGRTADRLLFVAGVLAVLLAAAWLFGLT